MNRGNMASGRATTSAQIVLYVSRNIAGGRTAAQPRQACPSSMRARRQVRNAAP